MDCLRAWCCPPARTLQFPPPLPKARDSLRQIEQIKTGYLDHLTGDFKEETHSLFPEGETRELTDIDTELKSHKCCSILSRISPCFKRALPSDRDRPSPWIQACCYSREGRYAMLAGFSMGCFAGQLALFCTAPTILVSIVSGVISGTANCSGTYFTLVDTVKRMEALDRKQDLHKIFVSFYNSLACHLITMSELEKRGGSEGHAQEVAASLLAKKERILEAFYNFFSKEEEEKYNEGGVFDQFFQACSYISTGDVSQITDHDLRTYLTTLTSETRIEGLEATLRDTQRRLALLEERFLQMQPPPHTEALGFGTGVPKS